MRLSLFQMGLSRRRNQLYTAPSCKSIFRSSEKTNTILLLSQIWTAKSSERFGLELWTTTDTLTTVRRRFAISLYKEYRGKGIGTLLMKEMLSALKERGYKQASFVRSKGKLRGKNVSKVRLSNYK